MTSDADLLFYGTLLARRAEAGGLPVDEVDFVRRMANIIGRPAGELQELLNEMEDNGLVKRRRGRIVAVHDTEPEVTV